MKPTYSAEKQIQNTPTTVTQMTWLLTLAAIIMSFWISSADAAPPCPTNRFNDHHYDLYLSVRGSIWGGSYYRKVPGTRFYCRVIVNPNNSGAAWDGKRVLYKHTTKNGNTIFREYWYNHHTKTYTKRFHLRPSRNCSSRGWKDLWKRPQPTICGDYLHWNSTKNTWSRRSYDGKYDWKWAYGYKRTRFSWPY